MDETNNEQFKKTKVQNNVKETKKGKKTGGVKLITIIIAIILIAVIAVLACKVLTKINNTPKETLDLILTELKKGDYDKIENYQELIEDSSLLNGEASNKENQKLLFEKLEWNIKDEQINEDTANVTVEITNKDFKKIISNYTQKVIKAALSSEDFSEDELINLLIEELKDESNGTATTEQTIKMKKVDGKWNIDDSESAIYALLPGLQDALNDLNSSSDE